MNLEQAHNLVYAVGRITPNGVSLLGTCFLIDHLGLFVTANHVANNDPLNLVVIPANNQIDGYQDTSDKSVSYMRVDIKSVDPIHDICVLQSTKTIKSNIVIGGADDVKVGEGLFILGYPHCTHGRLVLTYQDASVGAKVLIENVGLKTKNIVINTQTRPGQSGSPIFREADSKLVGVLIGSYAPTANGGISLGGIDPQTLHQTTHAISSEYINSML